MSAPYAPRGLLAKTLAWVRQRANEPSAKKYSDAKILEILSQQLSLVCEEVYSWAPHPPYARFSFTVSTDQQRYELPVTIQEIMRVVKLYTDSDAVEYEVWPGSRRHPYGPGLAFEENVAILVPKPELIDGETLTVEYIPGGPMWLHQNAAPIFDTDDDAGTALITDEQFALEPSSTAWWLGELDQRPLALLGQVLRIVGTVTDKVPAGYRAFPVQERRLRTWNFTTLVGTFDPVLDFDPSVVTPTDKQVLIPAVDVAAGRTYLLYEVLPALDPAVFWIAAYRVATEILMSEERYRKGSALSSECRKYERAAGKRWSQYEARAGHTFDTTDDDLTDDGMS